MLRPPATAWATRALHSSAVSTVGFLVRPQHGIYANSGSALPAEYPGWMADTWVASERLAAQPDQQTTVHRTLEFNNKKGPHGSKYGGHALSNR